MALQDLISKVRKTKLYNAIDNVVRDSGQSINNQAQQRIGQPVRQLASQPYRQVTLKPWQAKTLQTAQRVTAAPQKFLEGVGEGATYGLVDVPYKPSTSLAQRGAYGAGYGFGMIASPVNKLGAFAKLDKLGAGATRGIVSRFAPKATSTFAKKILPAIGAETAQSLGYAGAAATAGVAGLRGKYDLTAKNIGTDIGAGLLLRGAGRGLAGKNIIGKGIATTKNGAKNVLKEESKIVELINRYNSQFGKGTPDKADVKLVDEAAEVWHRIHGRNRKAPLYLAEIIGDLSQAREGILAEELMKREGLVLGFAGKSKPQPTKGVELGKGVIEKFDRNGRPYLEMKVEQPKLSGVEKKIDNLMKKGEQAYRVKNKSYDPEKGTRFIDEAMELAKKNGVEIKYDGGSYVGLEKLSTKGVEADFSFNMGKGVKQQVRAVDTPEGKRLKILSNELPLSQKQLIQVQAGQKIPSQSLKQGLSLKVAGSDQTIQLPSGRTQKIRVVEPQSQAKLPTTKSASESRLQRQLVGEKVDTKPLKVSSSKGIIPPEARSEIKAVERAVDKKVGIFDYLRTPDRVLKKIGLEKESNQIKKAYNNYLDELPKEIDKVTAWSNRVKNNKGAEQRIFKYLDGQNQKLTGEELKVAKEIKGYLEEWADKLDLPKDGRIASYITHIFEKDFIQKEFDPDLAKIIDEKIPGSVYDPFLQKRLGQQGYVEDVFRALDAYVKRATRKINMDPALYDLEANSNKLDLESWKYVKNYTDRINLRPTEWDSLLDNAIKQSPVGYKAGQRPTASLTRKLRQWVYRGTLGLNVGSAIRNLTQGVNTYAQLGEKYTGIGYMKVLRSLASSDDELSRVGVLRNNIIEDRSLSATKKTWENIDKGLFSFFEAAERINRGAAYYGAKARALRAGKSEREAIEAGVEMARKTQFTFGSVDTPVALQSDLVKLFTQFQSFNIKQTEFLGEMAKNKEYAGLARWLGANAVILFTVGQAMGWDWKDMIPFGSVIGGEQKIGETPPIQLAQNIGKIALGGKDKFGQPIDGYDVADSITPFIPAGVQLMGKTIPGLYDVNRGYATSDWGVKKLANMATGNEGKIKFPISQTPSNYIRAGVFGSSKLPAAREYKQKDRTVFGDNQAETFRSLDQQGRQQMYDDRNERLGKSGGSGMFGGLFNNQAVEPQTTSASLPTAKEDLTTLYKSATSAVDGYREKRVKSEAGLTQTKIEDLQAEVDQAIQLKKQIEKEHPELILDIGIDTYKSGGGASTEERAAWAAEQIKSVQGEEAYVKLLKRLYDGNVMTKSVVEALRDEHGIDLNKYSQAGKIKAYSSGGGTNSKYHKALLNIIKSQNQAQMAAFEKMSNAKIRAYSPSSGRRSGTVQPINTKNLTFSGAGY